jgi:uncharacterized protein YxeA
MKEILIYFIKIIIFILIIITIFYLSKIDGKINPINKKPEIKKNVKHTKQEIIPQYNVADIVDAKGVDVMDNRYYKDIK